MIRSAIAVIGVALMSSCSWSDTTSIRAASPVQVTTTYHHAGFGAGPVVFTDGSGQPVEERRLEPFGEPIGVHDVAARDLNPLNKRTDASTGWSDHGARWMVPASARWLTPDPPVTGPLARFMFQPWGLHPYQYVGQNPALYWDPDGRDRRRTSDKNQVEKSGDGKLGEKYAVDVVKGPLTVQVFGGEAKTSNGNLKVEAKVGKIAVGGKPGQDVVAVGIETSAGAVAGQIGLGGVAGELVGWEVKGEVGVGPVKAGVAFGATGGAGVTWEGGRVGLELKLLVGVEVEVDFPSVGRAAVGWLADALDGEGSWQVVRRKAMARQWAEQQRKADIQREWDVHEAGCGLANDAAGCLRDTEAGRPRDVGWDGTPSSWR